MQIDDNLPQFLLVLVGDYDENEVYERVLHSIKHLLGDDIVLNITNIESYIGKQAIDEQSQPIYQKDWHKIQNKV